MARTAMLTAAALAALGSWPLLPSPLRTTRTTYDLGAFLPRRDETTTAPR
jgi:hypothetical protein